MYARVICESDVRNCQLNSLRGRRKKGRGLSAELSLMREIDVLSPQP